MNTPTETLRRAAALMRERAKACQEGFEAEVAPDWYGQPRVVASALRREYGSGGIFDVDAEQWRWIVLTGLLLTAYVATWYAALQRAPAVDVTAVLVFGAVVTALLSGLVDGATVSVGGTLLVAAGAAVVSLSAPRRPAAAGAET